MLLKTKSPIVSSFLLRVLIILWIRPCKIWTKGPQRVHCKCIFLTGTSPNDFNPFLWKNSCIHLARKKSDTLQISFPQLPSTLFLKHLSTSWTFSTVSALNWNLWDILRTSGCTIFLFAFGVSIQLSSRFCLRLCKIYVTVVAFYFSPV